jgi:murein DD-endopeptidase MepM/ murein hydrolase activator NlpD
VRFPSPAVLLLALGAAVALVPASTARAPARAHAEARVAAGDLGTVGRVIADGDATERIEGAAGEDGLEIAAGSASVRASRAEGVGSARAVARAEGVVLLGGLVTAARVVRTATAAAGAVQYGGHVAGVTVAGHPVPGGTEPATYPVEGATVEANTAGAALRVVLTADRDGFAAGTEVTVAAVSARATDGSAPAPEPTPTSAATPAPTPEAAAEPTPEPTPEATPEPRRRRPDPARRLARGAFVFPVYGDARIADDFGAPRRIAGGSHQGNDIFAAFGAPVLAVADGVVHKVGTLPISGNRLWLRTDRGDAFFYAHLSSFAPDAVTGRRVKAGTLLGFTGNTGDAEPTPPHVHFQIHPGGEERKPIDPHAVLAAWQDHGIVASGGWLARYGDDTAPPPGALIQVRDFIAGE